MERPNNPEQIPLSEINKEYEESIETLKIVFGIENLSVIEKSHLRRITEDVLTRIKMDNTPHSDLAIINSQEEIGIRFLQELYGIDMYLMKKQTDSEEDREGFKEYIRRTRERAHLI